MDTGAPAPWQEIPLQVFVPEFHAGDAPTPENETFFAAFRCSVEPRTIAVPVVVVPAWHFPQSDAADTCFEWLFAETVAAPPFV